MLNVKYEGLGGTGLVTTPLYMAPNLSECNVSHGGIAHMIDKFISYITTKTPWQDVIPVIPVIPVQRQCHVMSLVVGIQGQKAYGLCKTPLCAELVVQFSP